MIETTRAKAIVVWTGGEGLQAGRLCRGRGGEEGRGHGHSFNSLLQRKGKERNVCRHREQRAESREQRERERESREQSRAEALIASL